MLKASMALFFTLLFAAPAIAAGPKKTILYNFTGGTDGGRPRAGVTLDSSGALYGATLAGGPYCSQGGACGVVFKLTPPQAGGSWTESPIYSFGVGDQDAPAAGVVFDSAGNLYGTTTSAPAIYQLMSSNGGEWTSDFVFTPTTYFILPTPLVDAAGNLYTADGSGNMIELSPGPNGSWNSTIISDLYGLGSPIMDKADRIYGATVGGGSSNCRNGCGTVFVIIPQPSGTWTTKTLFEFTGGEQGYSPFSALTRDAKGNLYGVAVSSGPQCSDSNCEMVFEISPPAQPGGAWTEEVIHTFDGGADGALLNGALAVDSRGALYGVTLQGGSGFCSGVGCGTVFRLAPPAKPGGKWTEVIFSFQGGSDGEQPYGSVALDEKKGALYGTTSFGGTQNYGTVYQIAP
jgi:uncharacterized repeat protein (TIGR03803 family)